MIPDTVATGRLDCASFFIYVIHAFSFDTFPTMIVSYSSTLLCIAASFLFNIFSWIYTQLIPLAEGDPPEDGPKCRIYKPAKSRKKHWGRRALKITVDEHLIQFTRIFSRMIDSLSPWLPQTQP